MRGVFRFLAPRLLRALIAVWLVSTVVFVVMRLSGDPVPLLLPPDAPRSEIFRVRRELGLDRPLPAQYGVFLANALRGDFGRSIHFREPAFAVVRGYLGATVDRARDALGGARGPTRGLHPHGAGQGCRGVARGRQAHAQERRAPDRDDHGPPVRDAARRRGRDRDGLRLAGDRPPRDPVHLQPRLPRRAVRGLPLRDRLHHDQLRDRSALRRPRPPGAAMTERAPSTSLRPPTEFPDLAAPSTISGARARRTARLATAGFAFVLVLGAVAVAAPWLAPPRQALSPLLPARERLMRGAGPDLPPAVRRVPPLGLGHPRGIPRVAGALFASARVRGRDPRPGGLAPARDPPPHLSQRALVA